MYVYHWREEQEAAMRASKGTGMTQEQVVNFVNGYYPCYELYTDVLRNGIFGEEKGKQLRLVVGKDRKVKEVHKI
ncbi:related to ATP-binding, pantothenate kinase [Lecanosticta acicola]|uniref:Related to ATP-binding, pantothenate kinase n=1 Tax=Lecanosticta acicola TaxID=111012 RepID=A0AAI8Z3G4_9PEZI|nr:related to ATP-binding, pantothenate kinase [Lecanosticta acicola]